MLEKVGKSWKKLGKWRVRRTVGARRAHCEPPGRGGPLSTGEGVGTGTSAVGSGRARQTRRLPECTVGTGGAGYGRCDAPTRAPEAAHSKKVARQLS